MTKRIFSSICLVAASVFLACVLLIMGGLYTYFSEMQQKQLRVQTELAAQGVANEGMAYFTNLDTSTYRITWVGPDGHILYDTDSDASSMENHLNREEIQEALQNGRGESIRYSDTRTERAFYAAKRLPDGSVLRLASTQYAVWVLLLGILQMMAVIAAAAALLALVLAMRLSKNIVRPLNELNLENPQKDHAYPELWPLLDRIRSQQEQLKKQSCALLQKQEEFNTAANSMNEGLVLLNEQGKLLSINYTASYLLSIHSSSIGKYLPALNPAPALREVLEQAKTGRQASAVLSVGGMDYQINASPVIAEKTVVGTALLIFDVTEKQKAEQLRREFTANVSHELRTPLHAISGYAELLKNGMVKPQDIPQFSGRIYAEAQRMIALIEDIIRLSCLDEGAEDSEWEETDLYTLAEPIIESLRPKAKAANVRLTLDGTHAALFGIVPLLNLLLFNLCDNAVKYNRPGGFVSACISKNETGVLLQVRDNGIGIPKEHQERVFERFYRVDKSRSKEAGGTGLGLSIVKHAAKIHNAQLTLHSQPGEGTLVEVQFKPPEKSPVSMPQQSTTIKSGHSAQRQNEQQKGITHI